MSAPARAGQHIIVERARRLPAIAIGAAAAFAFAALVAAAYLWYFGIPRIDHAPGITSIGQHLCEKHKGLRTVFPPIGDRYTFKCGDQSWYLHMQVTIRDADMAAEPAMEPQP